MNSMKVSTRGANTRMMIHQLERSEATLEAGTAKRVSATRQDQSEEKNSSTGPIRSNTGSIDSKSSYGTEMRSKTSEEDHQEEESEDNHNLNQSFTNQSINHSINQATDHWNT